MTINTSTVGPGTLTLGEIGSTIEVACQVSEIMLSPSKDQEDAVNTLCGDSLAGDISYTFALKGTLVQDWSPTGINKFCHTNRGVQVPFTFIPNSVDGPTLTGEVIIDPIDIGGKVKTKPTAEFEFTVVGDPTWTD